MTDNPTEVVTLRLLPEARQALIDAATLYGQSENDTANQAIQLWGWLSEQIVTERVRPAVVGPDGEVSLVNIFTGPDHNTPFVTADAEWKAQAEAGSGSRLHPLHLAGLMAMVAGFAAATALADWTLAVYGVLAFVALGTVGGVLAQRRRSA